MKKLLLVIVTVVAFGFTINAQEGKFNAGINLGIPVGTFGDFSSFALGAEVNYLFKIAEKIQVGPSASYVNYFGKKFEVLGFSVPASDTSFLPLAAAGRYAASDDFTLGLDLGYGIGISSSGGGFYWRPMVGYNVTEKIMLQATYSSISNGGSISNIGVGAMYAF